MLKQASRPKPTGPKVKAAAFGMSSDELSRYLVRFEERTKCEDALNELKRAVATLGVLRDAAENGECFDGKVAADALMFINAGIERGIDALERAIFLEPEGGTHD
jgi:hypothetical protein